MPHDLDGRDAWNGHDEHHRHQELADANSEARVGRLRVHRADLFPISLSTSDDSCRGSLISVQNNHGTSRSHLQL